jgi:hypothetical protein
MVPPSASGSRARAFAVPASGTALRARDDGRGWAAPAIPPGSHPARAPARANDPAPQGRVRDPDAGRCSAVPPERARRGRLPTTRFRRAEDPDAGGMVPPSASGSRARAFAVPASGTALRARDDGRGWAAPEMDRTRRARAEDPDAGARCRRPHPGPAPAPPLCRRPAPRCGHGMTAGGGRHPRWTAIPPGSHPARAPARRTTRLHRGECGTRMPVAAQPFLRSEPGAGACPPRGSGERRIRMPGHGAAVRIRVPRPRVRCAGVRHRAAGTG